MNTPSRLMPPPASPKKPTFWTWAFLAGLAGCVLWACYANAVIRWSLAAFTVLYTALFVYSRRQFQRLKDRRREDSICTFARALPARQHDTWVVRAVYEELSRHVRRPIRPSDDLKKDLCFDPDDLDDAAFAIARRVGRSMDDTKKNPMFDRVATVADMIAFFEHQPRK